MRSRLRRISDDEVLAGTERVVTRLGAARLTPHPRTPAAHHTLPAGQKQLSLAGH